MTTSEISYSEAVLIWFLVEESMYPKQIEKEVEYRDTR